MQTNKDTSLLANIDSLGQVKQNDNYVSTVCMDFCEELWHFRCENQLSHMHSVMNALKRFMNCFMDMFVLHSAKSMKV